MDSRASRGHRPLQHEWLCVAYKFFGSFQRPLLVRLLRVMPGEFHQIGFLQEGAEQVLVILGQRPVLRNFVKKLLGCSLRRA